MSSRFFAPESASSNSYEKTGSFSSAHKTEVTFGRTIFQLDHQSLQGENVFPRPQPGFRGDEGY
jgi:hypothetical protein